MTEDYGIRMCVSTYGSIAHKQCSKEAKDSNGRLIIYNLNMFDKAIYLTLVVNRRLGNKNYEEVVKYIHSYLVYNGTKGNLDELEYIPFIKSYFKGSKVFLRLCSIAFCVEDSDAELVENFVYAYFSYNNIDKLTEEEEQDYKEKLKGILPEKWKDKLLEEYRKYGQQGREYHVLNTCCDRVILWILDNMPPNSPGRIHAMAK